MILVAAGPAAEAIQTLAIGLGVLGGLVVLAVLVVLGRAATRPGEDGRRRARPSAATSTIERRLLLGGGVIVPIGLLVVVFAWTLAVMRDLPDEAPAGAPTIGVTAHQWWWEVEHPDGGPVLDGEIHIRAGEPVALVMRSSDVIHSLWVPDLTGKLDVLPDRPTTLVIEADEPGTYRGRCAEFCGLHHGRMDLVVVAHDPADYDAAVAAAGP